MKKISEIPDEFMKNDRASKRSLVASCLTKHSFGFLLSVVLGVLLTSLAFHLLGELASPVLELRLDMAEGGARAKLVNSGKTDVRVLAGGVESVLVSVPDIPDRYVIHFKNSPGRTLSAMERKEVVLKPGDGLDLGAIAPLIKTLPSGTYDVSLVYSVAQEEAGDGGLWRGLVRSIPLSIRRA